MLRATALLFFALCALAALAAPAAASPAPAAGAVFRRSCGDCAVSDLCEFGYPGTPEGHVACVTYGSSGAPSLYRRYVAVPTPCANRACDDTGKDWQAGTSFTPDTCAAACAAKSLNYANLQTGACWCLGVCNIVRSSINAQVLVVDGSACPVVNQA